MFPSHRNQTIDLLCESIGWFLYERNIGDVNGLNPGESSEVIDSSFMSDNFVVRRKLFSLTHFKPVFHILNPLNLYQRFSGVYQWVQKWNIGLKWVTFITNLHLLEVGW